MDAQHFLPAVSLAGSVCSAAFTAYFWLVRVRNERPRVRLFLSNCTFDLSTRRGDDRFIHFRMEVIAANCSVLPNSILKAVLRWRKAEGGWDERPFTASAMPINLPASHTVLLPFTGTLKLGNADVIEKSEERKEIVASQLAHWFGDPLVLQVELWTLQKQTIVKELTALKWTVG